LFLLWDGSVPDARRLINTRHRDRAKLRWPALSLLPEPLPLDVVCFNTSCKSAFALPSPGAAAGWTTRSRAPSRRAVPLHRS